MLYNFKFVLELFQDPFCHVDILNVHVVKSVALFS